MLNFQQNKSSLKGHTVRTTVAADCSCPINDHNTVVLLLCGSLAFFPVIQLPWMTIMQFRHCLLFNYRTFFLLLSLTHTMVAFKAHFYGLEVSMFCVQ